jgi:AcrR family transcriptional regulator
MLPPGRGTPRDVAERNQRERLFAAMVATVAKKGYEAMTVADLVELSGVSRSAFYQHFEGRQACFLATVGALADPTLENLPRVLGPGDEEAAKGVFEETTRLIVDQPAAAKMCFELYAVGPAGIALAQRSIAKIGEQLKPLLESREGGGEMPPEILRALIGGVLRVIHKRLYLGQGDDLVELGPQLWQWFFSYPPPPRPLRVAQSPSRRTRSFEVRQEGSDKPDRILRALASIVAERDCPETTVAEVVTRAKMSQRAFYEHFANVGVGTIEAIGLVSSRIVATALPALRSGGGWQDRVRGAQEAILTFWVHEPEFARFSGVEMYARGRRMIEQREAVDEMFEKLLRPGYEFAPAMPAIAVEAIAGALEALMYEQLKARGPMGLPELVPASTYICLAPFLGSEQACAVATQVGQRSAA